MKYEQERWDLLCLQAYTNPLPGSASSQLECYTSTVTAIVSVTLTATDIQGADLSEPLVLFWHLPDGDAKSDQWLAQVCSLYVRGSISVTETIAVTFEVDL